MRRPRNSEREKWVAGRQARYLGVSPEEVLGMIDRKGGDYYRSDLYPDQSVMSQAEDDFNTFRTGTTAMNQIADDMRSYYGVSSQPRKAMTNLPPEVEAQVAAVSEPYVRPQPRSEPQVQRQLEPEPMPQAQVRKAGDVMESTNRQIISDTQKEQLRKYALPAAGVTLAGIGLIEIGRNLGNQQSPGTILIQ